MEVKHAYKEKIRNLSDLLSKKTKIDRFNLLYPAMYHDLIWLEMPSLTELVGIDWCYKSDDKFRNEAKDFARLKGIKLKLLSGDATKPEEFLDDVYNVILDKGGVRSLISNDSNYYPSQFEIVLPKTNYFGILKEKVLCEISKQPNQPTCSISLKNPQNNVYHTCSLDNFKSEPENKELICSKIKEIEFDPGITKLWNSYLSYLEEGGVVVSFDGLSHYLTELGLKEIPLSDKERESIYFTRKEALKFNLSQSNWNEDANVMLHPPKLFLK